jgi:hypothetical protein
MTTPEEPVERASAGTSATVVTLGSRAHEGCTMWSPTIPATT